MSQAEFVDKVSSVIAGAGIAFLVNAVTYTITNYYMPWDHVFIVYLIVFYGSLKYK